MRLDLAALFSDPSLMFFGFEGDHARFAPMTRDTFRRSIFHDRRIELAEPTMFKVPLDLLLKHHAEIGFTAPRLHFIHHMAQTGSTILARALDGAESLVIREPLHLRQLGVHAGAGFDPAFAARDWRALLGLSLTMLGKRFAPSDRVVVKGNVPVSLIAGAIADADPRQPGILLYLGLDDYLAAVLRTPAHRQWVESVTAEIRLNDDPEAGELAAASTGEKAAALWASLATRYQRLLASQPSMVSLDANILFDRPGETIAAASALFGISRTQSEVEAVVAGPLFSTHAKNPLQAFDGDARLARRAEAKARLGDELAAARAWLAQRSARLAVPAALDRPLLGEPSQLL